ncbi:MAG TPA: Ppx/GppA family phosphatase, partial [Spongiibacteraceae bacterium]|nr:Ppx/GppA family phosphatase [Spongiibacteraceae bacterium]
DLGSNSFHLLLAELQADGWRAHLRSGDKVQLAAGLQSGLLSEAAIARGLACIERLAPMLRPLPPPSVRIVATHTLRAARNRADFIEPAQQLLGHSIEVISGDTEATLVYRGVADAAQTRPQLVVDIGGGSTELALGSGAKIERLASIPVGCVTCRSHFPAERLDPLLFEQAYNAVCNQLREHWSQALPPSVAVLGSSGTLLAIEQVLIGQGWSRQSQGEQGITPAGLLRLQQALLTFGRLDAVEFPGLSARRRNVFVTGVVIARALFDTLGIERVSLSQAALREGLVEDLLLRRRALASSS